MKERFRILAQGHGQASLKEAPGELLIGRMPGNDLVLEDPAVSRRHARVFWKGQEVVIEDLASRHGCEVNGRRIRKPTPISPGDRIRVGTVELHMAPAPAPEPSSGGDTVALAVPLHGLRIQGPRAGLGAGQEGLLLETLHALSLEMVKERASERLFRLVMDRLLQFLGASRGTILLLDGQGLLRPALDPPQDGGTTTGHMGVGPAAAQALELREAQVVEISQEKAAGDGDTTLSVMNVPLEYDGELLGLASFEEGERPFDAGDLSLTASLCNLAAAKAVYERRAGELRRKGELERQLQDLERKTRARTLLLAELSHEIRNPLSALLGYTELALQEDLPEDARRYLHRIEQVGLALRGLLNDFLDFSKAEAGKLRLESIPFATREPVQGALGLFEVEAARKGLALALDWDPGIPDCLVGDPLRIGQVLVNLVGNAVKFTERGEVRVSAALAGLPGEAAELAFAVTDTGVGMSEEQLERIFDPFAQGEDSTARRHGGTGLGLAICRALLEAMGGRLEVQSRSGEGSRFSFRLRLPLAPGP
ncbi:MAG: FHA domain-containing protein [Acidobacteria bacterium]|nr:FHA domain-containing protein [Acidobacteriota bacterium]